MVQGIYLIRNYYSIWNLMLSCKLWNSRTWFAKKDLTYFCSSKSSSWLLLKMFFFILQKFVPSRTTGRANGSTWASPSPWPSGPTASPARVLASKCPRTCSLWKKGKSRVTTTSYSNPLYKKKSHNDSWLDVVASDMKPRLNLFRILLHLGVLVLCPSKFETSKIKAGVFLNKSWPKF